MINDCGKNRNTHIKNPILTYFTRFDSFVSCFCIKQHKSSRFLIINSSKPTNNKTKHQHVNITHNNSFVFILKLSLCCWVHNWLGRSNRLPVSSGKILKRVTGVRSKKAQTCCPTHKMRVFVFFSSCTAMKYIKGPRQKQIFELDFHILTTCRCR